MLVGTLVLSQSGADDILSSTIRCAGGRMALRVHCSMGEGTALVWQDVTQQSRLNWSSRMNWLQNGVTQLVDGVKQLIKVDIGGGTVTLIAESAVVSEKRPKLFNWSYL